MNAPDGMRGGNAFPHRTIATRGQRPAPELAPESSAPARRATAALGAARRDRSPPLPSTSSRFRRFDAAAQSSAAAAGGSRQGRPGLGDPSHSARSSSSEGFEIVEGEGRGGGGPSRATTAANRGGEARVAADATLDRPRAAPANERPRAIRRNYENGVPLNIRSYAELHMRLEHAREQVQLDVEALEADRQREAVLRAIRDAPGQPQQAPAAAGVGVTPGEAVAAMARQQEEEGRARYWRPGQAPENQPRYQPRYDAELAARNRRHEQMFAGWVEEGARRFGHLWRLQQPVLDPVLDNFNPYTYPAGPRVSIEEAWAGVQLHPASKPHKSFTFDFERAVEPVREYIDVDQSDDKIMRPKQQKPKTSLIVDDDKPPTLICCGCSSPLRVSQGQLSTGDRLFSLACGHLVDQRCLDELKKPQHDPINGTHATLVDVPEEDELEDEAGSSKPNYFEPVILPDSPENGLGHRRSSRIYRTRSQGSVDLPPAKTIPAKRQAAPAVAPIQKKKVRPAQRQYEWACPAGHCLAKFTSWEIGGQWVMENPNARKGPRTAVQPPQIIPIFV